MHRKQIDNGAKAADDADENVGLIFKHHMDINDTIGTRTFGNFSISCMNMLCFLKYRATVSMLYILYISTYFMYLK